MKLSLVLVSVLISGILVLGCAAQPDIASINAEETYIETPGSLESIFTQLDEIVDYAEYIAEVEITDSEVVLLDGFPQTHSAASILTILKGDLQSGGLIEVVEEGVEQSNRVKL